MKKWIIIWAGLFLVLPLQSQDSLRAQLYLYGKNIDGKLYLRWAMAPSLAWEYSLKHAYRLQRVEILREGVPLDRPLVEELSTIPLLPRDSTFWKEQMEGDSSFALLAQALFGEHFVVDFSSSAFVRSAQLQQERDLRHGIALLAADRCFEAACAAGWGFVDSTFSEKSSYLYKLISSIPDSLYPCDTAILLRQAGQQDPLPNIRGFSVENKDNMVHLSWEQERLSPSYREYSIERSSSPKHFYPAHRLPLALTADERGRYHWVDTVPLGGSPLYYRVQGIDLFGQKGPFSSVEKCLATTSFQHYPEKLHIVDDGKGRFLHWDFDSTAREHLVGFQLLRSPSFGGKVDTLLGNIPPQKGRLRLPASPHASQYYTLVALYPSGERRSSETFFFQEEDSLAPACPQQGKAVVDSLGVVSLSWPPNTESDLGGYRIYRRLSLEGEAVQVSEAIVEAPFFFDTLSLHTDQSVYYQVKACDRRGNESPFSSAIEARPFRRFAPTSAQILTAEVRKEKIHLRWVNSSSENVRYTLLLQASHEGTWELVRRLNVTGTYDSLSLPIPRGRTRFRYALQSEGTEGERSPISEPAQIEYVRSLPAPLFQAQVDRENRCIHLAWISRSDFPYREIQIFRQSEGEALRLLRVLSGKEKEYKDDQLQINSRYTYFIRVIDEEGQRSPLSNALQVGY